MEPRAQGRRWIEEGIPNQCVTRRRDSRSCDGTKGGIWGVTAGFFFSVIFSKNQ